MRILVAEDDTALASFVKKGLEAEHYTVDVSADGEQARAMAGELDFDLVVLDLFSGLFRPVIFANPALCFTQICANPRHPFHCAHVVKDGDRNA
jgi:DNA-binding NarL/FixJ family response regulator